MCPLYVTGLFKPGERKSIEPSQSSEWGSSPIACLSTPEPYDHFKLVA
jgi:hypothetical protein